MNISAATQFSNVVNGTEVSPQDAKAFSDAAALVACQFGLDCSPNSGRSQISCARGACNLDAYQIAQLNASPEQYAATMRFHNQIVDALQNGNFNIIKVEKRNLKK